MSGARVREPSGRSLEYAVPEREEETSVLLHGEGLVHRRYDRSRVTQISREPLRAERLNGGYSVKCRSHTVTTHVQQGEPHVLRPELDVREGVAAERGRRLEAPIHRQTA